MAGPIYNPGQPYMLQIPGGFSPGRIAHITGTFTPTATSFILKFQSGPTGDPTDEIGLCIYGRVVEGVIGMNSFTRASGWGQEEATNSIALARGQNFDVTILCDPMQFKIALNGEHFAEYNHRTNPATLMYVNMASSGQDLTLACVWIEDNSAPVPPPPQAPYSQALAGMPYPPSPSYGPPPPYSGGPGFAPPYQDQGMYQQHGAPPGQYGPQQYSPQHGSSSGSGKGLLGMVTGAGAAVAGALGASHMLGKSKPHGGGYPGYGGYPGHSGGGGGGGGGILNKAMQLGGGLATAKMMSKPSKAMKYGVPLAGLGALGAGGYMVGKGMGGFHCGGSSSSGSSEEEE
ncbi:Galectin [Halocaridina rubra]|uniref:Galectin n=1 Tax=Halocaridina rubra TaxID=373956 RepID=A0AAN9A621_HALRR